MSGENKKKFGALKIIIIIAAVIIIGLIVLPFLINVNQFQPVLESKMSAALGREVKIGNLSLSLLSGSVGVGDIRIADDPAFSSSPFLKAKSLKVGVELRPLIFSKEIRITEIVLDGPEINLIRSSKGKWNFSSLGAGADNPNDGKEGNPSGGLSETDILIKALRIDDGSISIDQGGKSGKPSTYRNVNLSAKDLSFSTAFPFTLTATPPGGGSLSLKGEAGPISRQDMAATPLKAELGVKSFNLIESGFVSEDAGLGGVIDFNGTVASDGRQVKSQGSAHADRLQVVKGGSPAAQPVSLDYGLTYDLARQSGVLENAKLTCGKAVANLTGNFRRVQDSLAMQMKLRGTDMPVDDVKSLLPAFGVILPKGASLEGGVINTDMTAEGPLEKMGITGSADITKTQLTGFDLAGKMAVLAKLAGLKSDPTTDIETLASKVQMTPQGIRINDIQLIVPAIGDLAGNGSISSDQALDFKMQAQVKSSGGIGTALSQLTGRGGGSGVLTIPFLIQGTASDPKFLPDLKNAAGSILGNQFSKQGDEKEEKSGTEKAIGDALKNLFGK
jgi:AsmA protein